MRSYLYVYQLILEFFAIYIITYIQILYAIISLCESTFTYTSFDIRLFL